MAENRGLVMASLVGSIAVVAIGSIAQGKAPSGRRFLALLFVFAGIAFASEVMPQIAGPLALLVFLTILLALGKPALEGIQATTRRKNMKLVTVKGG